MKTFLVNLVISGRAAFDVQADNEQDAYRKAKELFELGEPDDIEVVGVSLDQVFPA